MRYPHLTPRKHLSIQATEVAAERMFSVAVHTITKLRAGMDRDTADKLFLHKNGQDMFPSGVPPPFEEKETILQMTPPP